MKVRERVLAWWCRLVEHSWAWSPDIKQYHCSRCGVPRQDWKTYYPPITVTGISDAKYPYVELRRSDLEAAAAELEAELLYDLQRLPAEISRQVMARMSQDQTERLARLAEIADERGTWPEEHEL